MAEFDLKELTRVDESFGECFQALPEEARGIVREILVLRKEIYTRVQRLMENPFTIFEPAIGASDSLWAAITDLGDLCLDGEEQEIVLHDKLIRLSTIEPRWFREPHQENIIIHPFGVFFERTKNERFIFSLRKRPPLTETETFDLQDARLISLLQAFREKLRGLLLEVERFETYFRALAS